MGDDDETELEPFCLVHRHQVDGIDSLVQRRDLLVRLGGFGGVEVLEIGGQVMVLMFIAVGRD